MSYLLNFKQFGFGSFLSCYMLKDRQADGRIRQLLQHSCIFIYLRTLLYKEEVEQRKK